MSVEVAILDDRGRGVVVAHMPAPRHADLPFVLNSMIEDARRFRFIPEFGKVDFTIRHEDDDVQYGIISSHGIERMVP